MTIKTHLQGHANDDWVAAVRAFVAVAQRAAVVPEPTPPVPPEIPPVRPPGEPEIEDPSPPVSPPREPGIPPPITARHSSPAR